MACHHRLWKAYMTRQHWVWDVIITFGMQTRSHDVGCCDAIIALGKNRRSNYVGHLMQSFPFGQHTQMDYVDVACHHHHWIAHTDEQRRAWHTRMAIGQHTKSDDVGCGIPSSPWGSLRGRMTSSMSRHLHPWIAQTVGQRRAWHAIITLV